MNAPSKPVPVIYIAAYALTLLAVLAFGVAVERSQAAPTAIANSP